MSDDTTPGNVPLSDLLGRAAWEAWCSAGRRIATPWDLKDKFERAMWVAAAESAARAATTIDDLRNEVMPPADEGPVERPVRPVTGARRLRSSEANAAKQAMKAGAHAALEDHYLKALEKIAYHDYGRWSPPFDPQSVAIEALKKAGVYEA